VHARFSAWYEFFPRSTAAEPGKHGTFADCEKRLPYIAEMGFNVVYTFRPFIPSAALFRKGRNNNPEAQPGEPGSPWAIGSDEGGHKEIHSELGTIEDFRRFVQKANELDLMVALDIAFQVAPDHPYVREHENWFRKRPMARFNTPKTLPKKYQDIYPFDFESEDWAGMWEELKRRLPLLDCQGVTIFRVDNPHTKAFPFWEWAIAEIKRDHPSSVSGRGIHAPKNHVPAGQAGLQPVLHLFPLAQREDRNHITYLTELTQTPVREFFRPTNGPTPPTSSLSFLQIGGRPAFVIRLLLAATLGSNYGIYGPAFELLECRPRSPRQRRVSRLGKIRNPYLGPGPEPTAFAIDHSGQWHPQEQRGTAKRLVAEVSFTDNDQLICYSKESEDRTNLDRGRRQPRSASHTGRVCDFAVGRVTNSAGSGL
jgi:starch synthase (maltosyl-transferring)